MKNNPFLVTSPESLTPKEIADLYVNIIEDLPTIESNDHVFIHGARGTGKSMLLRYLEPETQIEAKKCTTLSELKFFAVHIPFKNVTFISEINRLKGVSYNYFAEHLLVTLISTRVFMALASAVKLLSPDYNLNNEQKFVELLKEKLQLAGAPEVQDSDILTFDSIANFFNKINTSSLLYLKRNWARTEIDQYEGTLLGYLDFLLPALEEIRKLKFYPSPAPFFLMLDDADNTPEKMQRIINTWVSCRTNDIVSLKISTQLRYKTYQTSIGKFIEKPHDFRDIDLTTIYSPANSFFDERVKDIVARRFELFNIESSPEDFFPHDVEQENEIEKIKEELKEKHKKGEGRGFRAGDDAIRYARAIYMTSLAGSKKASSKYSYAGFHSIVNLANGVIRWFLEPASRMYNKHKMSLGDVDRINHIPVHIQDEVLYEWSEEFIEEGFRRVAENITPVDSETEQETDTDAMNDSEAAKKLALLIEGLGMIFRKIILSDDRSERRVFSFMIPDEVDKEIAEVLALGVEWGYLQKKYIGSKEGLGRKPQYILSRRLAPFFKLDTSGFAGNLSITSGHLKLACRDPKAFVRARFNEKDSYSVQYSLIDLEAQDD